MVCNIYRLRWKNEKDCNEGQNPLSTEKLASTDTIDNALQISAVLDSYETQICEIMGRSDYELSYGYVVFQIKTE